MLALSRHAGMVNVAVPKLPSRIRNELFHIHVNLRISLQTASIRRDLHVHHLLKGDRVGDELRCALLDLALCTQTHRRHDTFTNHSRHSEKAIASQHHTSVFNSSVLSQRSVIMGETLHTLRAYICALAYRIVSCTYRAKYRENERA